MSSVVRSVAAFSLLVLAACNGGPLLQPRAEWVRADRATYDAIGSKFQSYVDTDPDLAEADARIWSSALEDWRHRLEAAEAALSLEAADVAAEGGGE